MQRQQAGVELDGAECRDIDEVLRRELGDIGHDADIGVGGAHGFLGGRVGQLGKLVHGQAAFLGRDYRKAVPAAAAPIAEVMPKAR